MRKALKLCHSLAAIGFCGALASLLVLHASLPDPVELERFAAVRIAMGAIATWLLLPSMALVVLTGMFSMAYTQSYASAGWVWAKLGSGILVLEGTLVSVQGPMERAARQAHAALAGEIDATVLTVPLQSEWGSIWVILGVGVVNVILGVWRPPLLRREKLGSPGMTDDGSPDA